MLFWKIIAVHSKNHTKHINTLYWQNAELVIIRAGGTYTDHHALKN
jgi:hypothetical protein